jgi:glyoxylase-like metal-dependent hydrolase (beta-lactamase superfamily II)/rhodanese-related sulfurtransferase
MKVQQIYTGCLAQGAYYIESNGEAAIIDPLREVQPYIDMATERGAKIKYVFETHFHADFVSGHQDLAAKTGATIVFGPTKMETGFKALIATDGQEFKVGNATVRLIHTPGHTMESSCFLLINEEGQEEALFSGDTLFIGDVGRPDLAQKVIKDLTPEMLAGHLFESLRNKIMPLSNDLIVYPAHGKGSACGKMMSAETSDTLGHQKEVNYALNPKLTKAEFIAEILNGLTPPPSYFPQNVLMNIQGYEGVDEVVSQGKTALTANQFATLAEADEVMVLDTRKADAYAAEFIPGAINVGLDGDFAVWVGTILKNVNQKLVFVAEEGREEEVAVRLARIGFDHALGYLKGGMAAWKAANYTTDSIASVSVNDFVHQVKNTDAVLDVRRKSEYNSEHVIGAVNVPLDYFEDNLAMVPKEQKTYVHCAGGYRSMIFVSLARAKGYTNLVNVEGGFKAIKGNGKLPVSEYVCPTTML